MSTTYPPEWVQATVVTGMIGIFVIAIVGVHSTWHLLKEEVGSKFSRALYISFFIMSALTCFSFAFLRTDLILPMGDGIDCRIGFYCSTQGTFLTKIFLFMIFIYKIDLAFHESALAYSRWCLGLTVGIYSIIILALNALHMNVTWKLINLASFEFQDKSYGLCTSANDAEEFESASKMKLELYGAMFVGDTIFSIFVCSLFIYKLNKVVRMMKEDKANGDVKLAHLVRKQTILVIVACLTSALSLGIGSVFGPASLMISIDMATNAICVSLMFTFSDKYWRFIVRRVCCCCYCCVFKEEFLIQMTSISKKYSIRRDTHRQDSNDNNNKKNNDNNNNNKPQYTAPNHSNSENNNNINNSSNGDIINFNNAKKK
eukprot:499149_1